jgi:hypothetical protein
MLLSDAIAKLLSSGLAPIIQTLDAIKQDTEKIMAAIDDLEAKVAAEGTVIASTVTLLQGLNAELQAALANDDTARLQALQARIATDTQTLAAAVTANTLATTSSTGTVSNTGTASPG